MRNRSFVGAAVLSLVAAAGSSTAVTLGDYLRVKDTHPQFAMGLLYGVGSGMWSANGVMAQAGIPLFCPPSHRVITNDMFVAHFKAYINDHDYPSEFNLGTIAGLTYQYYYPCREGAQ